MLNLSFIRAFLAASLPFPSIFPKCREQNYFLLLYQKKFYNSFPIIFPISIKYYFLITFSLYFFILYYFINDFQVSLSHSWLTLSVSQVSGARNRISVTLAHFWCQAFQFRFLLQFRHLPPTYISSNLSSISPMATYSYTILYSSQRSVEMVLALAFAIVELWGCFAHGSCWAHNCH
jgi:hypothetical protein